MICHEPSIKTVSLVIAEGIESVPSAVSHLMQFPQSRRQIYPSEAPVPAVVPDSHEPRLPAAHMYSA